MLLLVPNIPTFLDGKKSTKWEEQVLIKEPVLGWVGDLTLHGGQ